MTSLTQRTIARGLSVAFLLPGVAGFIPNPIIGSDGIFVTNAAHNIVHLVTAALFLFMASRSELAARTFTRIFGVVYLLVGVLGFVVLSGSEEGMLLGLIHINTIDNFLHVGLGTMIGIAGFGIAQSPAVEQT